MARFVFHPTTFYVLSLVTALAALIAADDPATRNRVVGVEIGLAAIASALLLGAVAMHPSPVLEPTRAAKVRNFLLGRWVLLAQALPLVLMSVANAGGNFPWPGVSAVAGILAAASIAGSTLRHLR